jgi:hypothetical protein
VFCCEDLVAVVDADVAEVVVVVAVTEEEEDDAVVVCDEASFLEGLLCRFRSFSLFLLLLTVFLRLEVVVEVVVVVVVEESVTVCPLGTGVRGCVSDVIHT